MSDVNPRLYEPPFGTWPLAAQNVSKCRECPFFEELEDAPQGACMHPKHLVELGTGMAVWTDRDVIDPPPLWCPLRENAIVVRLTDEVFGP